MLSIRSAVTADVPAIRKIADPLVEKRILLGKELVELYESIQEFVVAELDGELVGFGALHVMWQDLGEVRTLAVSESPLIHNREQSVQDCRGAVKNFIDVRNLRLWQHSGGESHVFILFHFVQAEHTEQFIRFCEFIDLSLKCLA